MIFIIFEQYLLLCPQLFSTPPIFNKIMLAYFIMNTDEIFNSKFADILISNEQEQFNFLKVYPLFKRKQNLLQMWKESYTTAMSEINQKAMLNFMVLALKNDLIRYKTNDILLVMNELDAKSKAMIRASIIEGKSKTCIKKITLDEFIMPNVSSVSIREFNPKSFAHELTRMFAHLFEKITYHELIFSHRCNKDENNLKTPIEMLIDYFHKLNYIVLYSILIEDKNNATRTMTIKHILKICEELKNLNNYHGFFALVAGLNSSCIQKLDHKKYINTLNEFSEIINPNKNYKIYRDLVKKNTKCNMIPYVGVTIGDIVHILECPLYDEDNYSFNMELYNILLTIVDNFKNTLVSYNIERNKNIFRWISNIKIVYSDSYFYEIAKGIKYETIKAIKQDSPTATNNPPDSTSDPSIKRNSSSNVLTQSSANLHKQLLEQLQQSESSLEEFVKQTHRSHDSVEEVLKLTNDIRDSVEDVLKSTNSMLNIPKNRRKHKSMPIYRSHNNMDKIKLWSVKDVQNWLKSIDMDVYQDAFLIEEIDGIALYNLTHAYLKDDLHVDKLGHRLKILDAVRDMKNNK